MDDEVLKLECLKCAQQQGLTGEAARVEGAKIFNWLKGRDENQSDVVGGGKARVVGRDGTFASPFDDYVKE